MRFALLTSLLVILSSAVHAENWPQWRGPMGSGASTEKGLPVSWSTTENIAWKAPLRGLGVSSPIVWGDRVFVTSQAGRSASRSGPRLSQGADAGGGERALTGVGTTAAGVAGGSVFFLVTALDRTTGKQVWEFELPSEGALQTVHEKHNLASPSPATDGQRAYALFGSGQLVALDMAGKVVWKKNVVAEYGKFDINWGHGSSPIVYKDTLILQCYHPSAGYLVALDTSTGKVRWKFDAPGSVTSYSTPFVVETAAGPELIVNGSESLSGHSMKTGERLWRITEPNSYPIPSAFQNDGIVYTSRGYRSGPFMAIRPGGKDDVSKTHVVWKSETGAPYISSLTYNDGLIYMIGDVGVATAIDARDGTRLWQERVGGVYTASPIAADGKIYFFSEDGETVVLAAGRTAKVLSRNKMDIRILASPAVSGGRLFIRSDDAVFAIGK